MEFLSYLFVVFQSLSHVQLFATPWTVAPQASLSFIIFRSLLKITSFESLMPSNHLLLCHSLLLLPSIFPSIKIFSSELALHIFKALKNRKTILCTNAWFRPFILYYFITHTHIYFILSCISLTKSMWICASPFLTHKYLFIAHVSAV